MPRKMGWQEFVTVTACVERLVVGASGCACWRLGRKWRGGGSDVTDSCDDG